MQCKVPIQILLLHVATHLDMDKRNRGKTLSLFSLIIIIVGAILIIPSNKAAAPAAYAYKDIRSKTRCFHFKF